MRVPLDPGPQWLWDTQHGQPIRKAIPPPELTQAGLTGKKIRQDWQSLRSDQRLISN